MTNEVIVLTKGWAQYRSTWVLEGWCSSLARPKVAHNVRPTPGIDFVRGGSIDRAYRLSVSVLDSSLSAQGQTSHISEARKCRSVHESLTFECRNGDDNVSSNRRLTTWFKFNYRVEIVFPLHETFVLPVYGSECWCLYEDETKEEFCQQKVATETRLGITTQQDRVVLGKLRQRRLTFSKNGK